MSNDDYVHICNISRDNFALNTNHQFFKNIDYVITSSQDGLLKIRPIPIDWVGKCKKVSRKSSGWVQIAINSDILSVGIFEIINCDEDEMIIDTNEPYNSH